MKTAKWNYRVVKAQRGGDGKWFRYPAAKTFSNDADARKYAQEFAREQAGVAGTKILVLSRKNFRGPFGKTNVVASIDTQP